MVLFHVKSTRLYDLKRGLQRGLRLESQRGFDLYFEAVLKTVDFVDFWKWTTHILHCKSAMSLRGPEAEDYVLNVRCCLQGYVLDTQSPAVGAVLGGNGNSGPRGGSRSPGTNLVPSP